MTDCWLSKHVQLLFIVVVFLMSFMDGVESKINSRNLQKSFDETYPRCHVAVPGWIGDEFCHDGDYNTPECGWDGGDCLIDGLLPPKWWRKHPECVVGYNGWLLTRDSCDEEVNTPECGYDAGACLIDGVPPGIWLDNHPTCVSVIYDGDNILYPYGNNKCERRHNTEECDWNGGDCKEFNDKYPNCQVNAPFKIGNRVCDGRYENHSTSECGWDGGDCLIDGLPPPEW